MPAAAPTAVTVLFDDVVRVAPGNAAVRNGGGSVLRGVSARGRTLTLALAPLRRGDYSVRWSAVSDDGHVVQGILAFGVGKGVAPPVAELRPTVSVGVATIVSRWLFFAGLLVASGLALFSWLVWRPVAHVHVRTGWIAVALAAMFVSAHGLVHASHGGAQTRFGLTIDVASVLAATGAAAAAIAIAERQAAPIGIALATVLVPAPTIAGHALDPGRSWIDAPVDFLHVLAAALWIGGLVAFAVVIPRDAPEPVVAAAVRRFSRIALAAVVVLALTGLGRALAELSSVSQLWSDGYGRAVALKSLVFLAALPLAWWSRRRVRGATRAEALLVLGIVVGVAFLTALPPANRHVSGGKIVTNSARSRR